MCEHNYAVIMAGGKGERFWPMSNAQHPKPVLSLVGGKTLLERAIDQLGDVVPPERVFVITSRALEGPIAESTPSLPRENIIGEPMGRDTAAVVALASGMIKARDPEGVFCVLTADHIIGELPTFQTILRDGFAIATEQDVLITIGIQPSEPSTGFGYIETDAPIDHAGTADFLKARRFVEKPDRQTAESYLAAGNYYWNAGMFIWSVDALQNALAKHAPQLLALAEHMQTVTDTPEFGHCLKQEYEKLDRVSVDYAIMEKADNILTAVGTFPWDDVGSWTSLVNHFDADESGNVVVGSCEHIDAHGNIVVSKDHLVALVGVKDMVIVHTDKATLVCPRDRAQDVKAMVQKVAENPEYGDLV